METPKQTLTWDGEKIKQVVSASENKYSPSQIINAIDGLKSQKDQMQASLDDMKKKKKEIEENMKKLDDDLKDLTPFESKCEELQKEKVKQIINQVHDEIYVKSLKESEEEIAKNPEAYTESQKESLPYLKYQKYLATHPKTAEKIARRMISKYLYEEPVFDNPFKG